MLIKLFFFFLARLQFAAESKRTADGSHFHEELVAGNDSLFIVMFFECKVTSLLPAIAAGFGPAPLTREIAASFRSEVLIFPISEGSLKHFSAVLLQCVDVHNRLQQQQVVSKGEREFLRRAEGKRPAASP